MRALAYYRVSSEKQEKKASTKKQRRLAREYAEKKKIELVEEYEDPGISGEELEKRPECVRAFERLKDGGIDLFICYLPSRIGRFKDRVTKAEVVKLFEETQTSVYATQMRRLWDWDNERDMHELEKRFMAAREDNIDRSENVRDGHEEARIDGRFSGGQLPFGVRQQLPDPDKEIEHEFSIDEEKIAVVNGIFQKVADGWGYCKVRNFLNSDPEEVKRLRGKYKCLAKTGQIKFWTDAGIYGIIHNDFYTSGVIRTNNEDSLAVDTGLRNLVDPELVAKARRESSVRRPRLGTPNALKRDWLLHGLARCGYCGSSLSVRSPVRKQKNGTKTYHYYHCRRAGRGDPNTPCHFRNVDAERLERKVWGKVLEALLSKDLKKEVMRQNFVTDKDTTEKARLLKAEKNRLQILLAKKDRIRFNYEQGHYDGEFDQYDANMKAIKAETMEARENITKYTEVLKRPAEIEEAVKRAIDGLKKELELLDRCVKKSRPPEELGKGIELLDQWFTFKHPEAGPEEIKRISDLKRNILQKCVDFGPNVDTKPSGITVKDGLDISFILLLSSSGRKPKTPRIE